MAMENAGRYVGELITSGSKLHSEPLAGGSHSCTQSDAIASLDTTEFSLSDSRNGRSPSRPDGTRIMSGYSYFQMFAKGSGICFAPLTALPAEGVSSNAPNPSGEIIPPGADPLEDAFAVAPFPQTS